MKCQRCGASNAIGNRFCGNCGAPLTTTGLARPVGTAERPGDLQSQPASELRWVSVLFVDLVDYTALAYSWDAGDIRDMLAAYFDLARGIVGRNGGLRRSARTTPNAAFLPVSTWWKPLPALESTEGGRISRRAAVWSPAESL